MYNEKIITKIDQMIVEGSLEKVRAIAAEIRESYEPQS